MIKTIVRTFRGARALSRGELKQYARDYVDEALRGYGYMRAPSGLAIALPVVGAFGAGLAVGTGLGLLLAPKSGTETRADLRRQLDSFVQKVKVRTAEVGGNGRSTIITDDPRITHERPIGESS